MDAIGLIVWRGHAKVLRRYGLFSVFVRDLCVRCNWEYLREVGLNFPCC